MLDVWFDSGSTHAFTLEMTPRFRPQGPRALRASIDETAGRTASCISKARTSIAAGSIRRCSKVCGTRGHAPYDIVLTHGFVLDEKGQQDVEVQGNVVAPQDVMKTNRRRYSAAVGGVVRLFRRLRIGPEIFKTASETYRKLRNTLRWMLGALAHFKPGDAVAFKDMGRSSSSA